MKANPCNICREYPDYADNIFMDGSGWAELYCWECNRTVYYAHGAMPAEEVKKQVIKLWDRDNKKWKSYQSLQRQARNKRLVNQ